eukprot:gnl/TRDRNA2_/TRDRNA2_128987_c0_seq1.p1 gnl/TRDRNA2_/TRDRNA2_128987_c0~~gnl/TRDRNA2_/TRDRNA2_128987_c0_seq1.p1  ORF type:complete len:185 (+),score=13.96 gnl/TRDRNA2_/TRDRNA2_128987_c0_seq1:99-653(+)
MSPLEAYDLELRRRPLRTKLLTSACINTLSDLMSRQFVGATGGPEATVRQVVVGLGVASLVHRWYTSLDRVFRAWPQASARTVAAKTFLQMILLEPVAGSFYLAAHRLLQGIAWKNALRDVRALLPKLVMSSWSVWGPVAFLQYSYVPLRYRNLVGSVVNLFYTMYLIAKMRMSSEQQGTLKRP